MVANYGVRWVWQARTSTGAGELGMQYTYILNSSKSLSKDQFVYMLRNISLVNDQTTVYHVANSSKSHPIINFNLATKNEDRIKNFTIYAFNTNVIYFTKFDHNKGFIIHIYQNTIKLVNMKCTLTHLPKHEQENNTLYCQYK